MPLFRSPPADDPEDPGVDVPAAESQEEQWRRDQFKRLGYSDVDAWFLVRLGADWHEAERLLRKNPDLSWVYDQITP